MKIAYLIDWDLSGVSGVMKKVEDTVNQWEAFGHEVHLFIVSHGTLSQYIPGVRTVSVVERGRLRFLLFSSLKTFLGRNRAFGRVFEQLREIRPNIIYYRPGTMWYPNVSRCLSLVPSILEINSIDENEAKLFYHPRGIRYRMFFRGRRRILNQAKGIIALTREIANYLSFSGKPVKVIANGTQASKGFHKSMRSAFQSRAQLLFVGSPGQVWQGYDQFVALARLMPETDFHLVGPNAIDSAMPKNLKIYGFLSHEELKKIYKIADIGVGTLALYKKQMKEACPLKVREYIAYGLPVILGFNDTDLDGQEFVLNIGCHENNIQESLGRIKDFVQIWYTRYVPAEACQALLSIEEKERERLSFMNEYRRD